MISAKEFNELGELKNIEISDTSLFRKVFYSCYKNKPTWFNKARN